MTEMDTVWLLPPQGGEPKEVEATPDLLVPLMVQGWRQCELPEEVNKDAREHS